MNWLKGLLAAALSGAASTLGAMALDPDHFNTSNLRHLGLVAGLGAMTGTVGYLKQSPLPNGTTAPTEAIDPKRFAGMSVLLLAFTLPLVACTRPDLPAALQDAKWGLEAVCAIGQDTLSPIVCTDGLHGFDAVIAIAQKDPAHAAAAVKTFLVGLEARHPELHDFWAFITDKL